MKSVSAAILLTILAMPAMAATPVPTTPVPTTTAPAASAPAAQTPRQGVFEKADANHDGTVTKEEFLASEGAYFDTVDSNHDGKLTQDEIKAQREKSHAKRMAWKQEHATPAAAK